MVDAPVRIIFRGHADVRASDPGAIEIVAGDEWASRSRAIGLAPRFDPAALLALRGRVHATLRVGEIAEDFEATMAPGFTRGTPLLIRREPAAPRILAGQASKGAADLSRALVELLRGGADGELLLAPLAGPPPPPGLFALVGMPLGHQGDLTPRALDMLMSVDLILAEDTRIAEDALRWRGVRTPLRSCFAQREEARGQELAERLARGERVAFISDAGMPAVSDPGAVLVRAAVAAGAQVTAIPGPSAVPLALALSGFGGGAFAFLGFPPRKGKERQAFLERLLGGEAPTLAFESPARIAALLGELAAGDPARDAVLCRDLTKISEAVHRGSLGELAALFGDMGEVRGEYTLVVAAKPPVPATAEEGDAGALDLEPFVAALLAENCPTAPIVAALRAAGIDRRRAYDLVQRLKNQA
jgi:16S rRNA (cytidine1402-2'-O)-methyltransferase